MSEPKHKTIKVWFSTYRELRKLAAEKPESMAALIDRFVQAERERRASDRSSDRFDTAQGGEKARDTA